MNKRSVQAQTVVYWSYSQLQKTGFYAPDWLCARCLIAADPSSALFFLPGYFNQITACFLQRPVCVQVVV